MKIRSDAALCILSNDYRVIIPAITQPGQARTKQGFTKIEIQL
jgi:uncharacterized protein YaaW (UPF0174 family)